MAMTINTNAMSLNAQRNATNNAASLATTMARLSSGLRVNSSKDDAAGLAIADRMNTQVRGMNVAIRNANDGISLAQTAEGGLAGINDMLQRMRELAIQASNSINLVGATGDLAKLNNEYVQLRDEIGRTISATTFNGQTVLNSTAAYVFQVGANDGSANRINLDSASISLDTAAGPMATLLTSASASALTTTTASANIANISALDAAISAVNDRRATLGAVQSRFEQTIANLRIGVENQAAARGRIMDADFAAETANLSRSQILQQAGTAMIAQANQQPQNVMRLLQS